MTKHNHYFRDVSHLQQVDVYRILELFEVTCPVAQHIVKKALAAGKRGAKSPARDMQDIVDSAQRWLAMREEDSKVSTDAAAGAKSMTGVEVDMRLKQARKYWDDAYKEALNAPWGGIVRTSFIPAEQLREESANATAPGGEPGGIDRLEIIPGSVRLDPFTGSLEAAYNLAKGAA